ncbi:MAG TPA: hypothetical protein VJT49_04430 [Amycolatopsis sp.]|uniref:hypothetical protein n=1 Tax=Amycolatopsis sp. TaxID=37632 RepID=UPI002B4A4815|nr:hypothetical protein [Amycolatopsis sp.]HKS44358.1 hypothetical protein [Amycolatopsis sp.]
MAEPIMASYVQEDGDWTITVSGLGRELTSRAPGIIAARDRADQLVENLGPSAAGATVVHLLNGSALEFTSVYITARLTRSEPAPLAVPEPGEAESEAVTAGRPTQAKSARRTKAKLTADIGTALSTSRGPAEAAASGS